MKPYADRPRLPDKPPRGPDEHKRLAKQLGRNYQDLLALSHNHDPYYKGRAAHWREGRWFADLWQQFDYGHGVHIRRIHYQALSAGVLTPDGESYTNTSTCFELLSRASRCARELSLVNPEAFEDRRNHAPIINVHPRNSHPRPATNRSSPWWDLPSLDPDALSDQLNFPLPTVTVTGYDYDPADQPVLLEVWIEKSTMDDVLVPLCRDLHVNLVRAAGLESITAVVNLLRRAERHGRPAHVLYVSDFDPAGVVMPVSVSRQVQFWRETLGINAELMITPVALTAAQVEHYRLPRVPVKVDKNGAQDRRGKKFEAAHGEGVVELDALEALHPGALVELLQHHVNAWQDAELPAKLRRARLEAGAVVRDTWDAATEEIRANLEQVESEIAEIVSSYRDEIQDLSDRLAGDLAPYRERLERLRWQASETYDTAEFDLPPRPEAREPEADRSAVLYDSRRHWWEQLKVFKRRQNPHTGGWWSS